MKNPSELRDQPVGFIKTPPKLIKNSWECPQCHTVLTSTHVHDFVECACGNFVDGGLDYCRIGGPDCFAMINKCEYIVDGVKVTGPLEKAA